MAGNKGNKRRGVLAVFPELPIFPSFFYSVHTLRFRYFQASIPHAFHMARQSFVGHADGSKIG
ncbi:MAG: hypothetical protein FWB78_11870, partial [Treponema sp.]|nr:hypothetical protein [Treponema sp.]